jgi:hypothetical protein
MENEDEEDLSFEDIDILESIGSDLCEGIRDLICCIKEIKSDVKSLKNQIEAGQKQ